MPQTPILVPARLRRPPKTGWSWVDRRFLRERAAPVARRRALVLRPLRVADKHGLSFYGDGTMATLVRISLPALMAARDELLARDLIAHEHALYPGARLAAPSASAAATSPAEG